MFDKMVQTFWWINAIGGLNISDFIQKLPITKIYSSPVFHLIWYLNLPPLFVIIQLFLAMSIFLRPQGIL